MPRLTPRERNALLLAPLAAPFAYGLGLVVFGAVRAFTQGNPRFFGGALLPFIGALLGIGAPIAYAATALIGVPAYLTLRRAGWVGRLPLGVAGSVIGGAVAMLLGPSLRGELFSIPFPVWAGMLVGLATAEVFYRLLGRSGERPPDAGAAG